MLLIVYWLQIIFLFIICITVGIGIAVVEFSMEKKVMINNFNIDSGTKFHGFLSKPLIGVNKHINYKYTVKSNKNQ